MLRLDSFGIVFLCTCLMSLPYDSGNKTDLWIGSPFGLQFRYNLVIFVEVFDVGIWRWSIGLLLWVDSGVGCFMRVLCKTGCVCDRAPCCYRDWCLGLFLCFGRFMRVMLLAVMGFDVDDGWSQFERLGQLLISVTIVCVAIVCYLIAGWRIWWMFHEFFFGLLGLKKNDWKMGLSLWIAFLFCRFLFVKFLAPLTCVLQALFISPGLDLRFVNKEHEFCDFGLGSRFLFL